MLLWCGISMAARDIPALETGQTEVFLFLWDLCISGADRDDGSLAVEKGKYRFGVERCDGCHSPVFLCMDTGGASGTVFYWLSGWNFLEKGMRVSLPKIFFFSWMVFTAAYVPCLLAFYPGLYTYDMSWQWQQFLGYGYTTHHPLIHTFFASWLIELGNQIFGDYQKGLFLHSVVQMLIMTGSMAFAMTFLVKWKVPKNIWIGDWVFLCFFPILSGSGDQYHEGYGIWMPVFNDICLYL